MSLRGESPSEAMQNARYLKNEQGRIFIATDILREKPGMSPATEADLKAQHVSHEDNESVTGIEFVLSKASKSQILRRAKELYQTQMDKTLGIKELRVQFTHLEELHAGDNPDQQSGE